jgi:hypothetical protein
MDADKALKDPTRLGSLFWGLVAGYAVAVIVVVFALVALQAGK